MGLSQTEINSKNNLINNISYINSIQELTRSLESVRETYISSMQGLTRSLESVREPYISSIQELTRSLESVREPYISSIQELTRSLESVREPYISAMQELSKAVEKMKKSYYSNILQNSLNQLSKIMKLYNGLIVDYEREVEIDGEYLQSVDNEEMANYVDEVNYILQDESISIIERIEKVLKKLCVLYEKAEKFFSTHPIMFFIVTSIIVPIMRSQLNQFSQNAYKTFTSISQSITENYSIDDRLFNKNIKKEISKELSNNKEFDKQYLLNTYRFVNCEGLNVRVSNTMKSSSIYKLTQGSVVKIINKQKNWTKIEYKNEDETVIIKGWVNTRYISRFN